MHVLFCDYNCILHFQADFTGGNDENCMFCADWYLKVTLFTKNNSTLFELSHISHTADCKSDH